MCFDRESSPPILAGDRPIASSGPLVLESADGTPFAAFEATPEGVANATVLVLPDVRGLHPYYEELTCRFAQHSFRALAIDWYGRTAGSSGGRPEDFAHQEHVERVAYDQVRADVSAAVAHLRATGSGDSSGARIRRSRPRRSLTSTGPSGPPGSSIVS